MAIENTTRKTAVMQGNGISVKFPFSFRINSEEDLIVYVKKGLGAFEEQILNTDYELTDLITDYNGNITGGNIKYPKIDENAEEQPAPLTDEDYIYAIRETPRNQLETSEQVSFKSKDIERGLDKACMQIQELTEDVSRCIKTEEWQDIDPDEIINSIYEAEGQCGEYATEAGNSATDASGYSNNASTSATNSQKWAEGSDADVSPLGGTHSSKGWAEQAEASAQSIDTAIANKANKDLDNLSVTGEAKFTAKANTDLDNLTNTGKSLVAGLGMPSVEYDDLTLGTSGDEYTAPANGYFNIYIYPVASTGYVKIQNASTTFECETRTTVNSTSVWAFCPARKGEKVKVYYDVTGTTSFKFHYAEGSKQEAN